MGLRPLGVGFWDRVFLRCVCMWSGVCPWSLARPSLLGCQGLGSPQNSSCELSLRSHPPQTETESRQPRGTCTVSSPPRARHTLRRGVSGVHRSPGAHESVWAPDWKEPKELWAQSGAVMGFGSGASPLSLGPSDRFAACHICHQLACLSPDSASCVRAWPISGFVGM